MQASFLSRFWRRFRREERGNVAILFSLSALALIGIAGLGIDYYRALTVKARLDLAADAAALAAINTAQAYIIANSGSQTDPTATAIAQAQAQALKVFKVNAGGAMNLAATPAITVTRGQPNKQTLTASVVYTAVSPNMFGTLFGVRNINLTNAANGGTTASLTMGKYLDFYLLIDVSGSMGLPSTTAGQLALASINPDQRSQYPTGCVFACHFTEKMCNGAVCQGYALAAANNIQLRAAAVGNAVQALLATAQSTETITNQYRVGIYPFISQMGTFYALSSNLSGASNAISALGTGGLSNLLDTGQSSSQYGSGGTHFENALPSMNSTVQTVGDGSGALLPQPFVFLVTDGADNNQFYTTSSNSWTGSQPQNMDPSLCTPLKNRGITISVLYIPYPLITNPNPSFAGDEDDKVNAIIPNIPASLQSCASPGFFFTANTPTDITNAMQAMFAQALAAARLTH
jgi:Flp pilus assembly protein TadG